MISPFTGGEVKLCQEQRELIFRKEKFAYTALFYVCLDTKEQFTTTELDEINLGQVHNQYRSNILTFLPHFGQRKEELNLLPFAPAPVIVAPGTRYPQASHFF